MRIILLKDIKGVGKKFEEKEVSDGHAANFLIPRKMAVSVAGSSAAYVRQLKEQAEKSSGEKAQALAQEIAAISGTTITIKMKANEKGHLFASLTPTKISELLKKEGREIDPEHLDIREPIKAVGTFVVPVKVGEDKETNFTLEVVPA
ncbi:MAG: 50S ribosomal protein L9 [Parcubacteria group bacterium]